MIGRIAMSNVRIIKPFKAFGKRSWPNKMNIASTEASNVYKVGEGNVLKVSKKMRMLLDV
jgi:hypothetical protein